MTPGRELALLDVPEEGLLVVDVPTGAVRVRCSQQDGVPRQARGRHFRRTRHVDDDFDLPVYVLEPEPAVP